ncbi:MAG: hypothetical protein GY903_12515, partial [Fuerstiella sp.]|nr:hypothetical protein [Fuerstiella sp.]
FKAEGVTLDKRGTLYIISEPNLLYVFKKAKPQPQGSGGKGSK